MKLFVQVDEIGNRFVVEIIMIESEKKPAFISHKQTGWNAIFHKHRTKQMNCCFSFEFESKTETQNLAHAAFCQK